MIKRLAVIGVVLAVLAAAFVWFFRPPGGELVEVEVGRGATTSGIAAALQEEDVIASSLWFRVMARVRGLDGRIQAGRYELRRGAGVQGALDVLSQTPAEEGFPVTVPEGYSVRQIAERLGRRSPVKQNEFLRSATDGSVRASIQPPGVDTLEGFLFPETYLVGENETAQRLVRRMVATFEEATGGLDWSGAERRGLSRYEVLVAASLVEREARIPEDRSKVAAVLYNRLAKGMKLQIDITALYGLDEHKVPSRADLRRPSPYNTYLIDGLPPTPIANPGLDAIDAVLHPADIDAIYYVVCEPSGRHCFTDDFGEFQRLLDRRPAEVRG